MLIEVKRDEHIQVFCDSQKKKKLGEKNATGFHHHSAK